MLIIIKKPRFIKLGIFFVIVLLLVSASALIPGSPTTYVFNFLDEKEDLTNELQNLLNNRSDVFITGDYSSLENLYDTSQKLGRWAWEQEIRRVKYLRDWALSRNIQFSSIKSQVVLKRYKQVSENRIKVNFDEVYKFDYIYKDDAEAKVNSFGVRLMHVGEITKNNDTWKFYKDWYLDCFNDAVSGYNAVIPEDQVAKEQDYTASPALSSPVSYNREKAVQYADKYCAVPWANRGGHPSYNKKYKDYNGIGGDCTNYVSQCLGDKEGGNLRFDGTWFCHYHRHGSSIGSAAWLNAQKFKNYILYSGKGRVLAKGTYKKLTSPAASTSGTAPISRLMLGDIISYEEKGCVVHNAIITGFDSRGYPLVNTHTVDRYRVPWDLGWGDKDIQFFLIHIK